MNERLENEKISKLLLSMAIPAILAQLATLIYNMVDRIYIGQLPDRSGRTDHGELFLRPGDIIHHHYGDPACFWRGSAVFIWGQ